MIRRWGSESWSLALVALACACGNAPTVPDGALADAGDALVDVDGGPIRSAFPDAGLFLEGVCAEDAPVVDLGALPHRATILLGGESPRDDARPSAGCSLGSSTPSADAIFRVDVPGPGFLLVRTDLPATDPWLDTTVYVRDGCGEGSRELACDDDGGARGGASRLLFEVDGAAELLVAVDGVSADDRGQVELLIDYAPPPAAPVEGAESCAGATELGLGGGDTLGLATGFGDTMGASNELGCADVPSTFDLPDQFFAFELAGPAEVLIEVVPEDGYDTAFYVLPGCSMDGALACQDQSPHGVAESVVLDLEAGRYILAVDAFLTSVRPDWSEGPYTISVISIPR